MPYDGAGNFTRSFNWVADKLAAIKIQAARMDGEFDEYAAAMNQVILRNGVAPYTGDLKMGGNKITGIGAGVVGSPSLQYSGDTMTGIYFPAVGVVAFAAGGIERARGNSSGFCVPAGQLMGVGTNTPRTTLDVAGFSSVRGIFEDTLVTAVGISGTVNIDAKTQAIVVFDANAAGNWTFNIRGDGVSTLDSLMGNGQSLSLAIEVPQGVAAFYCTAITVDGGAPSQIKWFGGGAPTGGNASGIDVYTVTVIKKAAATFYVRASQSQAK